LQKKIKYLSIPTFAVITAFSMIGIVSANAHTETTPYSWYCRRNEEHKLPVREEDMKFIDDYEVYYVDSDADDSDKVIYLTFDAGYENGNVEKTLDILKKHNAKGSFFILENLIKRNTELVKRMFEEGHTVGNHTLSHLNMSKVKDKEKFRSEIEGLSSLCKEYTGFEMSCYYRPPEGRFSEQNLIFLEELGYKTVLWSFAYDDWDNNKQPSPEKAMSKIMRYLHNGEVMLLHPTSETNAEILDGLLTELENMGYRFGSLEELCEDEI